MFLPRTLLIRGADCCTASVSWKCSPFWDPGMGFLERYMRYFQPSRKSVQQHNCGSFCPCRTCHISRCISGASLTPVAQPAAYGRFLYREIPPPLVDNAVWEKITKGRAGTRWDIVVDKSWKDIGGDPIRGNVYREVWRVQDRNKRKTRRKGTASAKK